MSSVINFKKIHIVRVVVLLILFVVSLAVGYSLLKDDQKENCWNKYSTEQEAIENCEGKN